MKDLQTTLRSINNNQVTANLLTCNDREYLNNIALEYDWDNGFDIPLAILSNPCCSLGTALVLFYQCEGYKYLLEKPEASIIPEWLSFISKLYSDIKNKKYTDTSIHFEVPLSKIQIFKLKKMLTDEEQIFVTNV